MTNSKTIYTMRNRQKKLEHFCHLLKYPLEFVANKLGNLARFNCKSEHSEIINAFIDAIDLEED